MVHLRGCVHGHWLGEWVGHRLALGLLHALVRLHRPLGFALSDVKPELEGSASAWRSLIIKVKEIVEVHIGIGYRFLGLRRLLRWLWILREEIVDHVVLLLVGGREVKFGEI